MSIVQFDPISAERFCRMYSARGYLTGCGMWPTEKWIAKAEALATGLDASRLARMLKACRAGKAKLIGCHCSKCGRPISDPDSVLAGMGPECQAA